MRDGRALQPEVPDIMGWSSCLEAGAAEIVIRTQLRFENRAGTTAALRALVESALPRKTKVRAESVVGREKTLLPEQCLRDQLEKENQCVGRGPTRIGTGCIAAGLTAVRTVRRPRSLGIDAYKRTYSPVRGMSHHDGVVQNHNGRRR